MDDFNQPEKVVLGLREVYSLYSDRTHPVSDLKANIRGLPAFNTPILLSRELELAFTSICKVQPVKMFALIDLLWQEHKIELRQLAATLLGRIPIEYKGEVVSRLSGWTIKTENDSLLEFLHKQGTKTIRDEKPEAWLEILEKWKQVQDAWNIRMSIQGLMNLVEDPAFVNLPAIFTFLFPLMEQLDSELVYPLQNAVESLAKRSEVETVYFLKEVSKASRNPAYPRFLRKSLEFFSPENQESLKRELRTKEFSTFTTRS